MYVCMCGGGYARMRREKVGAEGNNGSKAAGFQNVLD